MAALTPSAMRALILRSKLITLATLDRDSSTYSEAGNEPSRPTATVSGYQDLSAAGTLTSDTPVDFRLTANKSGAAVGSDEGGRFHWRKSTDALTDRRGSLAANKVTGAAFIDELNAVQNFPRAVTLPNQKVVVVYQGSASTVKCAVLNPVTETWSSATVDNTNTPQRPAIVQLPNSTDNGSRLVAIYRTVQNRGGTTYYTLSSSYSDDEGATWTRGGTHIPGYNSTTDIAALYAFYHDGFITLLVLDTVSNTLYHLVSDDLGSSFDEVENFSTTGKAVGLSGYVDTLGNVVLIYVRSSDGALLYGRKSSPRGSFPNDPSYNKVLNSSAGAEVSGTVTVTGATVDAQGYLYVVWQAQTAARNRIKMSRYDPDTLSQVTDRWLTSGATPAMNHPISAGTNTDYLSDYYLTPYKAGLVLLAGKEAAGAGSPADILAITLGGYSSIDWQVPTYGLGSAGTKTGELFVPFEVPATAGSWTTAGAGTGTLNTDGYQIATSGNALSHTRNGPSGAPAGAPVQARIRLKMESGGALASDQMAIRLRRADNSVDYDVSLRFAIVGGDLHMRVYDNEAGAQVGSDVTGLDKAERWDVLIAVEGARVRMLYKLPTTSLWTQGVANTALTDGGAGTTTNQIDWGGLATGTATATWYMLGTCCDNEQTSPAIVTQTNPDDLQGAPFANYAPQWLGDTEGVTIRSKGGPVFAGDAYTVATRARYGLQHLDPVVSPARSEGWRSVSTTLHNLVWTPNGGAVTRMLSSSIGVYLYGFNAALAYFEGQQSGGTWDTLITFNGPGSFGTGLTYTIDGDVVRPASGTGAGTQVIEPGSLIGGYVLLTHSGGTNAYPITDNTGGLWQFETGTRPVEIRLGTSPSLTTPTDIKIIPPALAAVAHNITTPYKAFRLRIPASQTTYEGYYTLGHIHAGPLLVFGKQYSRGRIVADEAQVERVTLPSGLPVVRSLGRSRRRCEFGWVDGIDTQQLHQPTSPDYIRAKDDAAYLGIALRHDPYHLGGLLRRQEGALPLVYLPGVSADTGSAQLFSQPRSMLFGWPGEVVTHDHPLGDENSSEIITINTFTITEGG